MNAKQLARQRLARDVRTAVREAAAMYAWQAEDGKSRLNTVMGAECRIVDTVCDHLERHYRVIQRARPERAAT